MAVKMKPTSVIKARVLGNGRAQQHLTNLVARYNDKYVPYGDTGLLRINIEIGKNYVLYKSGYAHYIYKSILFVDPITRSSWASKDVKKVPTSTKLKYHTAGTGSHWDKNMMSAEGKDLTKELNGYIDRGCK